MAARAPASVTGQLHPNYPRPMGGLYRKSLKSGNLRSRHYTVYGLAAAPRSQSQRLPRQRGKIPLSQSGPFVLPHNQRNGPVVIGR